MIAQGPPSRIIELAVTNEIDLVVPEHALTELERVLETKLSYSKEEARGAAAFIRGVACDCPPPPADALELSGDRDDDLILASARSVDAEVLVTGDRRHLLPLRKVGGMRILTAQALLAEVRRWGT